MNIYKKNVIALVTAFLTGIGLAACGGSSTGGSDTSTTGVSGTVYAATIQGASVTVKTKSGTTVAGPVQTGSDGSYTINIPTSNLANDLIVESTGGTFTDEATGATGVTGGAMAAYIAGGSLSSTANKAYVTASSTIVKKMVDDGQTFTAANTEFNSTFGYTPDTTKKPDTASTATDATQKAEEKLSGFREAVFSQFTKDLGLTQDHQFDLINALASDLSDGTLDGMHGTTAVVISGNQNLPMNVQNKFETATTNWLGNTNNTGGLMAGDLAALPFSKMAMTTTYMVTYVPGTMAASASKTAFQLKVASKTTSAAVSGLSITLTPTMHMSMMTHTTPVDGCTESSTAGAYDCTVYYLMGSGMGMGYWDLIVTVNGETADFYPSVSMAMGTDTVSQTLRFSTDTFSSMGTTTVRPYLIYKDSLTAGMGGTYTWNLFIAARETLTSHKGLYTGLSLNSGAFTVNTLSVQASTDGTTWANMTENSTHHGRYSASGLTGLTSGMSGSIYVRLVINGNSYNNGSTGVAGGAALNYGIFTVTPGSM